MPDLDHALLRFRVASRELFNTYFRVDDPYQNGGWELEERFSMVEQELFRQLVEVNHSRELKAYGQCQPLVRVNLRNADHAPIMINRGLDTGYWDDPLTTVTAEASMSFIRFFDWDLLAVRDNQYVRVRIDAWPSHPEVVGREALIEAQYSKYSGA